MYKLIGLDLDGTLLNSRKEISPETIAVLNEAKSRGIKIVLASGRPPEGMYPYLKQLGLCTENDYVVCYNGSVVKNVASGKIIHQQVVSASDVKQIATLAEKLNVNTHAFSQTLGLITPKATTYTQLEATINGIDIHETDFSLLEDDHPMIKAMMVDEPENLAKAIAGLPETLYQQFTIVQSAPHFLEFLNPLSNKGLGIEMVARHFNIQPAQIICFGDAENDHHMIEFAGMGVAMGNAMPQTKAIADYITTTNDDHGVAKGIEKLVLS
ncbi:Sugar phosphatase YidA [Vibrio aerogenes CECT 7868]|uniref:Sugar phosphatase YidA n=1 Tax=Vibrio aerogenes CECT 7868 TaxID=1216006 RepID=A0A1M5XQK8_9VIBR|nr:Cof-type HAD-IIB family hydrolase [Vibrio aerogenes]SHI01808.1 Sugar phosphatase YidA [Vibrio aerogenes CECT 7868]